MYKSRCQCRLQSPVVRRHPSRSLPLQRHRITRRVGLQICQALDADISPDGMVVLPVFPGSSVLLPASRGMLRAFEPKFMDMFNRLLDASPTKDGRGARFMHILSPKVAPPAMLDSSPPAIQGLPSIGCCAIIESITTAPDQSLIVEYSGHRRVLLHLVQAVGINQQNTNINDQLDKSNSNTNDIKAVLHAAGEWYDDIEPEELDPFGTVSSIYAAERDVAGIVQQIARLSRKLDPEASRLPDALVRYAPPSNSGQARPTSYDALKAAKHPAATSIDMWRRSSTTNSGNIPKEAHADPYTHASELLGRLRRQEMYSFAAASLLQLGVPEATALLLSRDTAGRLQFVLEAARPYLAQLSAEAALKGALE
ncbi:hypothetical protein Ndes2437B_g05527 [Nannochloris sp. 'desiccata']|nr:hypothetical protein KSW81_007526 [Chlorella desiccata (nom. nud.)]